MPSQTTGRSRTRHCRLPHRAQFIVLVMLCCGVPGAHAGADRSGESMFSFGAFGTFGLVHSSEDQADFVANGRQPKGPGYTASWSATPDTKLGAQVTATFNEHLSAVVQAISQYQADGSYMPQLEWANLKYQFTADFDIRAGRIAIPTFMSSDSLNIGYALPFVRIPLEIYVQLPVTNSDGIDAAYRLHIGAATNTVQAFAGGFDSSTPHGGHYNVRELLGVVDTLELDALTLHLSYQTLRYDLRADGIALNEDHQSIGSVGMSYDPGKWFLSAEWERAPDDQVGLYYGWYVIGGYRIRNFTPYFNYARANMGHSGTLDLPPFIDQDTSTLGLRWDFVRNADLKVQLDHTERRGGLNGFFLNQQPGFQPTGTVNLLSLTVDFVF